jgi:hypothetical protein
MKPIPEIRDEWEMKAADVGIQSLKEEHYSSCFRSAAVVGDALTKMPAGEVILPMKGLFDDGI